MLKKKRTLAAKIETTIGTAETLTGVEGVFNAYNLMVQATIPVDVREAQGSFGHIAGVPGARMGVCSFRTDVGYDDTTVPNWATVLLPACGWVNATGTFTPRSESPGTNVKTVTIGIYQDGQFKRLSGAVGTFNMVFPAGRVAYIDWTFTGVWVAPTDTALITPTYPTTETPLRAASMTTTFNSVTLCFEQLSIDAGNQVVMRECTTNASGYASAIITDRNPTIKGNPEAVLVATQDRFGLWLAGTEAALSIAIAAAITITVPKAQITNIQEGDRNKVVIDEIEWAANKNGVTADQEVSIVFS